MITSAQTRNKYVSIEDHLQFARDRLRETLLAFCEPEGYAFVSRIKTLSSTSEKIESGRFTKWSEVDDLIACAIVVPTLTHEPRVLEFLQKVFIRVDIKRRGSAQKAPELFRFDTTRFIGRLRPPQNVSPDEPLYNISFEVQVRTAFEHAWSVTTHALTYKAGQVAWNRLRLTAQLKAAVEQLDILILGFEDTSSKIAKSFWPETQAKTKVTAYFKAKFASGVLPIELSPQDWTRFSENIYQMVRASPWAKAKHPIHVANEISRIMEVEIVSLGRDRIPLSISLAQFVFASLATANIIVEPLDGYCPVITSELETLYPALRNFQQRFDFSR